MIESSRDDKLVSHLQSEIRTVKKFDSLQRFLQHFRDHSGDPYMIIISNPINIDYVNQLIHHQVRKLYIHCSNDRSAEYDTWHDRNPQLIYVLLNLHRLTQCILWDLSICITEIGQFYAEKGKEDLAENRFLYAYRLRHLIDEPFENQREVIEDNQATLVND